MIGKDRICAVVAAQDERSMWKQLQLALKQTRTVELRLDWLVDNRQITHFLRRLAATPPQATMIATCRRREAGGRFHGTIAKQLFFLAEALRAGCSWYDLEIETASKCPPELIDVLLGEGSQILSAHFFRISQSRNWKSVIAKLRGFRLEAIKVLLRNAVRSAKAWEAVASFIIANEM